jgi:hypothetical protein
MGGMAVLRNVLLGCCWVYSIVRVEGRVVRDRGLARKILLPSSPFAGGTSHSRFCGSDLTLFEHSSGVVSAIAGV